MSSTMLHADTSELQVAPQHADAASLTRAILRAAAPCGSVMRGLRDPRGLRGDLVHLTRLLR